MARARRRARTDAPAAMPTISVADVEAWARDGRVAIVYRTPLPAPRTVDSAVAAADRVEQEGQFGYHQTAGSASRVVARFTFDDGRFIDVVGDGVIGRDPADLGDPRIQHVISLDDPLRELSRVHLTFGVEPTHELWIADQHSTNGVQVTRPEVGSFTCAPGVRTPIDQGDIVSFAGHAMSVTRLLPVEASLSPVPAAAAPAE